MSKAQTYARMLDHHYSSNTEKNIAAHLRALDASHQRLKEALEAAHEGLKWYRDRCPGAVDGSDDEMDAQIDAAIEQAKDLE